MKVSTGKIHTIMKTKNIFLTAISTRAKFLRCSTQFSTEDFPTFDFPAKAISSSNYPPLPSSQKLLRKIKGMCMRQRKN
jgi:hypothetical protein